ncbi:DJ-1/PfpI family protein [Lysobacter humi (ex Lee et al. 2017)]
MNPLTARRRPPVLLAATAAIATGIAGLATPAAALPPQNGSAPPTSIPAWIPGHGGDRPLVAIAAENGGTELTDFAIPYGVFRRAGIETVAVAAHEGPMKFLPALQAELDTTMAEFDEQHPEGADYVIVPALKNYKDPTVSAWIREQARKGATVVSICDGAFTVGATGLLDGKWATAHWASESARIQMHPLTHWVRNTRYVSDGKMISSAGISAAMPTSLALVEAMAGKERAAALAAEMGVADYSPRHDSESFRPRFGNLSAFAMQYVVNPYLRSDQRVGVPLVAGMDEISLAITADAYSRTGRSQALSVSRTPDPVTTRFGLRFVPDAVGKTKEVDLLLPPLTDVAPGKAFDSALAGIAARYGKQTAKSVALDFEYPGYLR